MQFTKMNGAGNDFIILNNLTEHIPHAQFPSIARTLCHRRLSIGADGLMVVDAPRQGGDFRMLFYNADGSEGEMCGNGARCICRYGYEKGLAGETQTVESPSGLVTGRRIDQRNYRIRLTDPSVVDLNRPVDALGRALRRAPAFPKGANVNFYDVASPQRIIELTYERGVEDFTYACGTGSGSTVLALTLLGKVSGKDVEVSVPGGTLRVDVDQNGDAIQNIWLTGPTNFVCEGAVLDEDL